MKLHVDPPIAGGDRRTTVLKHLGRQVRFRYACGEAGASKEARAAGRSIAHRAFDTVTMEREARDQLHGVFDVDGPAVTLITDVDVDHQNGIADPADIVARILDAAFNMYTVFWVARNRRLDVNAAWGDVAFQVPRFSTFPGPGGGGAWICEHGRQRSRCKECGGSGICEHGRQRRQCKACGGSAFCEHGRQRSRCKECGGSGLCEHGRQRSKCKECREARDATAGEDPPGGWLSMLCSQ